MSYVGTKAATEINFSKWLIILPSLIQQQTDQPLPTPFTQSSFPMASLSNLSVINVISTWCSKNVAAYVY